MLGTATCCREPFKDPLGALRFRNWIPSIGGRLTSILMCTPYTHKPVMSSYICQQISSDIQIVVAVATFGIIVTQSEAETITSSKNPSGGYVGKEKIPAPTYYP